jgi:hypothetical protein
VRAVLAVVLVLIAAGGRADYSEKYSREAFGQGWQDLDGDGRHARDQALEDARQAIAWWWDPYTGAVIFDAGELDIDHIVPLAWAWRHGASSWPAELREAFANDPQNLVPVLAGANRSKGAKGPDEWMPPNIGYWRIYLARFVAIADKYRLTIPDHVAEVIACLAELGARHTKGVKLDSFTSCR